MSKRDLARAGRNRDRLRRTRSTRGRRVGGRTGCSDERPFALLRNLQCSLARLRAPSRHGVDEQDPAEETLASATAGDLESFERLLESWPASTGVPRLES